MLDTKMQGSSNQHSVSLIFYKTLNSVLKSSRKIIFRVCEVASVKKSSFKMFNLYSTMNRRNEDKEQKEIETTGHDRFCQERPSRSTYRKKKKKNVRRAQSVAEFETTRTSSMTSNKRLLFRGRSVSTEYDQNSESEHSEKSPLVSTKLDSLAKLLFSKSIQQDNGNTNKESDSPTRHNTRYQYTALDSGIGASDRSPRERAARDRALTACQDWIQGSSGRYEVIAHLDDIGSRPNKQWFLLNDSTVRTDRLMTLLPIPPDCVALEELPPSENPKGILMELLGSLQHPYIYPVLDLGFLQSDSHHYACLVMPFNPRGSLKDLIYKSQWNEPWNRKYTRKSTCLPMSQVQRLGRQILEALLFLRERGFPSHGHLHSGNVILQNGVARLSGVENGLLGLNSRVNAVNWSRTDVEHIDVICFGHLLFEMCAGYELGAPQPSPGHLEIELERYPQVAEVLSFIFDAPDGRYPTIEELVLCDLFRNIDLREMRGTCVPSFKHGLSNSTLSLLQAVRRRQGAFIMGSSLSEGSTPCTPPSTPRDRRTGDIETPDITSSDSEGALDEIVIETSVSDFPIYDPMHSPIHFCDNSVQSDDSIGRLNINEIELCSASASTSSLSTQNCKNSKSRRMEYSMKGMKLAVSNNPSQDSAFGSMTDDVSIASSSFRLSSFQSISSPIDEGVEDLAPDHLDIKSCRSSPSPNDLNLSNLYKDEWETISRTSSRNVSPKRQTLSSSSTTTTDNNHSTTSNIYLEPPTLLINDQRSIYTSSPSKRFGSSIEVFSQKYRVSSFEDMTERYKNKLKKSNKITFRSFEEERRIDSAFTPINLDENLDENRVNVNNNEKYKKLTHASFTSKINNTREKHILWKNSILSRKNNLIKSNESLLESNSLLNNTSDDLLKTNKLISRVNSINEISSRCKIENETFSIVQELKKNPKKSKSEKFLFSLSKLKQNPLIDYFSEDDYRPFSSSSTSSISQNEYKLKTTVDNETDSSDENCTDSLLISPTHGDACKLIGGLDEKTPLLDGMEMSPITPTEPEQIL